jgi:hypothetical protein
MGSRRKQYLLLTGGRDFDMPLAVTSRCCECVYIMHAMNYGLAADRLPGKRRAIYLHTAGGFALYFGSITSAVAKLSMLAI